MKNYNATIKKFAEKANTSRPIFRKQHIVCDGVSITKTVTNSQIMLVETYPVEAQPTFEFSIDIHSGAVSTEKYPDTKRTVDGAYLHTIRSTVDMSQIDSILAQAKVNPDKLVHIKGGEAIFVNGTSFKLLTDADHVEVWLAARYLKAALETMVASQGLYWEFFFSEKHKPVIFKHAQYEVLVTPVRVENEEKVK